MSSLNYFNMAQQNNLNLLSDHLDKLLNNKKSINRNIQPKNDKEEKINYNNKKINQQKERPINEYINKAPNNNIYKKKSIQQKFIKRNQYNKNILFQKVILIQVLFLI